MSNFKKSCYTNCDKMLNFAKFENGGTNPCILLLNSLSISLLSMLKGISGYFFMQKNVVISFQVTCTSRWSLRTFG